MKIKIKLGNLIKNKPIEYNGKFEEVGGQTDILSGKHQTIIETEKEFDFELEGKNYKTNEAIIY